MDNPRDNTTEDDEQDLPPERSEASVRLMLEQSVQDIAEGRIVPGAPVLDRMRVMAEKVRRERLEKAERNQRSA